MESGPALDPHKEKNSIHVVCLNLKKKKKVRHESVFKQIQAISYLLVLYIRISVVLHENSHAGDVTTVSCALQWSPSCMILQTVYTADQKFWSYDIDSFEVHNDRSYALRWTRESKLFLVINEDKIQNSCSVCN